MAETIKYSVSFILSLLDLFFWVGGLRPQEPDPRLRGDMFAQT
jgi:hypothetical protein